MFGLKKLFRIISNQGVEGLDAGEGNRVRLLNQMSFFIAASCILCIPIFLFLNAHALVAFVIFLALVFGLTVILNFYGKYKIAKNYNILMLPIVMILNVFIFGNGNGGQFFFFPYIIATIYIFREEQIQWFYMVYYLLAMAFCFASSDFLKPMYVLPNSGMIKMVAALGACSVQIAFLRAFNLEIFSNEKRINQLLDSVTVQNEELEEQKNILTIQATELQTAKKQLLSVNEILEGKVNRRTEDLHKTNSELLRSNKDLEEFAYVASHDLQEPLRMVGNFVQLLDEEYGDKIDAEGKTYINYAVDGVKRMSKLIEELLSYSRVGRKEMNLKEVDLNVIVKKKLLDLEIRIQKLNAEVKIGHLPTNLFCEPSQIGIIFYNLVANGLKFNNSKFLKIEIKAKEEKNNWLFSVADNGIGIEEKNKHKIFKLFKRLHRKEEYEGTGIGLSLCRKIIIRHDGKIWFKSKYGTGTTFYFTIGKNLRNE